MREDCGRSQYGRYWWGNGTFARHRRGLELTGRLLTAYLLRWAIMSLQEFMAVQAANAEGFSRAPHFISLLPLVDRMYTTGSEVAAQRHSPTLVKLMMLCHREFLVAASQIQRGLPFDSHANTRRAVEIAKVALAVKRNPANAEEWLNDDLRKRRWDARERGKKPERLTPNRFPELDKEPLIASLQDYFGVASDMYIHFTPEYFGQQVFSQRPVEGDSEKVFIALNYFTEQRPILFHAIYLSGLHVRVLLVFDAVFDNEVTGDAGWSVLRVTFDQLAMELLRDLPPPPGEQVATTEA